MKTRILDPSPCLRLATLLLLMLSAGFALAQTPVDESGQPVGEVYSDDDEAITLLSAAELDTLVGPVALYPDDLLAITLSASTYPLEIVQAARYLEELQKNPDLKADPEWDDSVVALLNYPEVLQMMSEDIDWTWRLGEAVVAQQKDVVAAIEQFRDRAYAAGNLESDDRKTVSRGDGDVIEIAPAEDDVIYVPYYEPEQVVVYQSRPVYHYYPRPYPVYYYPYPSGHHFTAGYFWGVTTAFRIGWLTDHLHVHHHSFHGHPYFGRNYHGSYWRRPSISVFNTYYGSHGYSNHGYRQRYGSYWRPRRHGGARPGHHYSRDRYYTNRRRSSSDDGYARDDRRDRRRNHRRDGGNTTVPVGNNDPVRFRARENRRDGARNTGRRGDTAAARRDDHAGRRSAAQRQDTVERARSREQVRRAGRQRNDNDIVFRSRSAPVANARRNGNRADTTRRAPPQRANAARRDAAANRRTTRRSEDLRRGTNERRSNVRTLNRSGEATPPRRAAPTRATPSRSTPARSAPPPRRSAPAVRNRSDSRPSGNRGQRRQSHQAPRSSSKGSTRREGRSGGNRRRERH